MDSLMNETLLIEKNAAFKGAKKKQNEFWDINAFVYRIDGMQLARFGDDYPVDFGRFNVRFFNLETLALIIAVVETKIKKGIRKSFIFYSTDILMMVDNLTVSLTEYVVYYYHRKYGVNIYITQGEITNNQLNFAYTNPEDYVYNGFYALESSVSFIRNSFLLEWVPRTEKISRSDFYCEHKDSKRCKLHVGTGPWDASIAISKCTDFLGKLHIGKESIGAVCDVVGELAPNAVEHGGADCIFDICYENAKTPEGNDETNISIVIYNFSEKLLWTDLFQKVFVDNNEITFMKDRIDTIRRAWEFHSTRFSKEYKNDDFYNLMAFQKLSGRPGDRNDGGLGINALIQNVQKYSTVDYCYVLSGNGALRMDKRWITPDELDYIAFNEARKYVDRIPENDAVMRTSFFMPGVAYNLLFYFMEEV